MNLYVEIPNQHLEELSRFTDGDFVLAHLFEEFSEYRDFYLTRSKMFGVACYLDNGCKELGLSIPIPEYLEIERKLKPQVIVAPDVLSDWKKTMFLTDNFLTRYKGKAQVMGVVQGKNNDEFVESVKALITIKQIDIIGVPHDNKNRRAFIERNVLRETDKRIHLLGTSSLSEVFRFNPSYRFQDIVSIDTRLPIDSARQGLSFLDRMWLKEHVPPECVLTEKQLELAKWNTFYYQTICHKVGANKI